MSGYLVIFAIGAVVLLAVWRWDEHTRRAELDRQRRFRAPEDDDVVGEILSKRNAHVDSSSGKRQVGGPV